MRCDVHLVSKKTIHTRPHRRGVFFPGRVEGRAKPEPISLQAPIVTISIDTEEDNWGSYSWSGATVENIKELPRVQEVFDRWGARPTYLVNYAPLVDDASARVLGELAARDDVEIGGHCHPWNTPPRTSEGVHNSMMFRFSESVNLEKVRVVRDAATRELGVTPRSFRAGRWGYGETVSKPLRDLGFDIDCSVSPLIDWSDDGGPDFGEAPYLPFRFDPERPLEPDPGGAMTELPPTIGFLRGDQVRARRLRRRIERSLLARFKVVGLLSRAGLLTQRWLSPEFATGDEMIRLSSAWLASGMGPFLQLTFHSCTLLPGATPFVRDQNDRTEFLGSIDVLLRHLAGLGCRFETLAGAAQSLDLAP